MAKGKKGAMREASKLGFKAVRKPLIAEAGVEGYVQLMRLRQRQSLKRGRIKRR